MKLRTRLIISFCIIIFVPVLLAIATIWGFGQYQMKAVRQIYNIDGNAYDYFVNSFKVLSRFTKSAYEDLQDVSESRKNLKTSPTWKKSTVSFQKNIPICLCEKGRN